MVSGISCYVSLMFMFITVCSAQKGSKRVVEGELIEGRNSGYDAVRYYAVMATRHGDPWWWRSYGYVKCGGALITPRVVQTACHCISVVGGTRFGHGKESNTRSLTIPKVQHSWESSYNVYVGVNQEFGDDWSMASVDQIVSKKFVIDPKCAFLPPDSFLKQYTHDYGWILTEDFLAAANIKLFDRVNFAPIYSVSEMNTIWGHIMQRQPVCLNLGFGSPIRGVLLPKNQLLHGWTRMLTYSKCVALTKEGLDAVGGLSLMSWVCTVPFSKHNQSTSRGDSGGPLSCNNVYFAIVMGGDEFEEDNPDPEVGTILDTYSPIAFALYQNALEWRTAFQAYMEYHGRVPFYQFVQGLNSNPTFKPFLPRRYYHQAHSFSTLLTSKFCMTTSSLLLLGISLQRN